MNGSSNVKKLILKVSNSIDIDKIKDIKMKNNNLELTYNGVKYSVIIENALQSYIKINDEEDIEIINKESVFQVHK